MTVVLTADAWLSTWRVFVLTLMQAADVWLSTWRVFVLTLMQAADAWLSTWRVFMLTLISGCLCPVVNLSYAWDDSSAYSWRLAVNLTCVCVDINAGLWRLAVNVSFLRLLRSRRVLSHERSPAWIPTGRTGRRDQAVGTSHETPGSYLPIYWVNIVTATHTQPCTYPRQYICLYLILYIYIFYYLLLLCVYQRSFY